MTVCLTMIVKDAADSIERCLDSAVPLIDTWTILDTGSSDDTCEIIERVFGREFGIPGNLHLGEFEGFGITRSKVMGLARGRADYLMLLDADMEVEHDGPLPALTTDVYEGTLRFRELAYALPILVRGDRPWRYEGVAHSYLACDGGFDSEVLPGLWVKDGSHTSPAKLHRDLELLGAEHARDPLDARTAFYLAQTYYDLDRIPEAIAMYRLRANLDGWDEETYYARYRLGALLCEHVSFAQGAQELLRAWEMRPGRAEALRVLSNVANNVADKIPLPADRLFVRPNDYARAPQPARRALSASEVSAVIVTRGNVDLTPVLATLPYDDVVVWDNSQRPQDMKIYGRYAALRECKHDVVFFQDDDVLFTAHEQLLAEYEPGVIVANMDAPWVEACGYHDMVLLGAGSIADRALFHPALDKYLTRYPRDPEFLLEADFVVGTMVPGRKVDLGYEPREFTDDPDRLYRQPGQQEAKERTRSRARLILGELS